MSDQAWRDRLRAAVEDSGKSKRKISLEAGLGPGYVHSILGEGKDPTIDNLLAICREIGVSLSFIVYGMKMDPAEEELLALVQSAAPEDRQALLQILRRKADEKATARP